MNYNKTNKMNATFITVSDSAHSIKANEIRTNLLLHAQSELLQYKHSKTRINSKLTADVFTKYDSIEIVIENPLELGNAHHQHSHNNLFEREKSNSSTSTPCPEEIGTFVKALNKTICSDRKLHTDVVNAKTIRFHSQSSEIIHRKRLSQMKKSCQLLRRLALSFILKPPKSASKSKTRKIIRQKEIDLSKLCLAPQGCESGVSTQRYHNKAKIEFDEELLVKRASQEAQPNKEHHKHKTSNFFRTRNTSAKVEEERKTDSKWSSNPYAAVILNQTERKKSRFKCKIDEDSTLIRKVSAEEEIQKMRGFIVNERSLPFGLVHRKEFILK